MSFDIKKYEDYWKYKPIVNQNIDIKELMTNLSDIYDVGKYVGCGDHGISFNLDNDKILKITTDKSEAYYANVLCNKQFNNICNIYDVKSYKNLFIILYEKVILIKDSNEKIFLSDFYFHYKYCLSKRIDTFESIDLFFSKYENKYLSKRYKWLLNQIFEIFKQCSENGIMFIDCHQDNLGYNKNGNLCLFDIGNQDGQYNIRNIEKIIL